jgi:hypothetical protein
MELPRIAERPKITDSSVYPAIYDFSILPIGLGSILGWNIKQSIRAIDAGRKQMDVYVVADNERLSNLFQGHISEKNYQVHLLEVMWAFYTNPMLRNIHFYLDRKTFEPVINQLARVDGVNKTVVESYIKAHEENHCRENADKLLIEYCEGYKSIFKFHDERGYIPYLVPPRGCDLHAKAFRQQLGEDNFIVTTNFRMGQIAVARAEDADHTTASTFSVWYDFFKLMESKRPDVKFLILGKLPEVPAMCLDLKNVIAPRRCGLNLGHELALIMESDLFLGAASGFASMAWFNEVPFVITGLNKEGYSWVGYDFGIERYNFSKPNQRLVFESESVPMLASYFEDHYQSWKNKRGTSARLQDKSKSRVAFLGDKNEELKRELRAYMLEKISAAGNFSNAAKAPAIVEALEALATSYPGIVDQLVLFHSSRALALFQMKRVEDALKAISKAIELEPDNPSVRQIEKLISAESNIAK